MMIKPASSACNLACDYCFYLDLAAHRTVTTHPFMNYSVMEAIIKKSLKEANHCSFMFQGGEPSLVGLPFYEKFVETVNTFNTDQISVSYAFQTNGLVIDASWAHFFKNNNFLVGVSFDGTPRLHDTHRFTHLGAGSGRKVQQTINLLREKGVEFNILSVITNEMAQNVDLLMNYATQKGFRYLQFIPCLSGVENMGDDKFLRRDNYTQFLKNLFDRWYIQWKEGNPVSIRFFDNLVGMLVGYPPESCDMAGICSVQYVAESNGNIYPCDFYCDDENLLGNIVDDEFSTLDSKREQLRFIEDSPNSVNDCSTCQWRLLCRGGCKRNRSLDGYRFCSSMKEFFPYAIQRLENVANTMLKNSNSI